MNITLANFQIRAIASLMEAMQATNKEIVLKSKESYIHKYPKIRKYQGVPDNSGDMTYRESRGRAEAEKYYVTYKAYKLQ